MSKGSTKRPGDDAAYRDNWERIFGNPARAQAQEDAQITYGIVKPPTTLDNPGNQWTGKYIMPAQTCGNCKHYTERRVTGRNGDCVWFVCTNPVIMDIVGPDTYGRFEPPADFGCNKWMGKP